MARWSFASVLETRGIAKFVHRLRGPVRSAVSSSIHLAVLCYLFYQTPKWQRGLPTAHRFEARLLLPPFLSLSLSLSLCRCLRIIPITMARFVFPVPINTLKKQSVSWNLLWYTFTGDRYLSEWLLTWKLFAIAWYYTCRDQFPPHSNFIYYLFYLLFYPAASNWISVCRIRFILCQSLSSCYSYCVIVTEP